MSSMVKCVLCGSVHDWADPDDGTHLVITDRGRWFVCSDCITDILCDDLDRRGL